MACTSMASISLNFQHFRNHRFFFLFFLIKWKQVSFSSCCWFNRKIKLHKNQQILSRKYRRKPISALASGLEASISDADDKLIALKDAKIVVESKDENKIQLRVDVTGIETQKVFNKVLTDLARQAPPIPGFRREKGGKTTKVPREFLLQILGEERVTKFVVQEIVTSTVADYVKEENLNIKDKKVSTSQSAEELKVSFTPGKDFWFNAVLELEESENS
ncbi:hypothetical protein ERO13_A05G327600v2 [Gossypium hirsutum]|uniref:peptidylprolyl isomerase n=3 Tax=Gossypium TaxID=3633 RepID=A0A1U8PAL2_GOSHI|nr:uncharacterized protein LOC107957236 isoform X2 [Gossypium hirsutum]KAG4202136.1 hypothetical protein ERO13_A05G327600v2 [Gossypium hirsutum]TYH19454.1 hypothetical protein ES288_A05G353300v1 [Gossypium darwinii]TYI30038.1 hypothetical protein ES332_A05G356600v1 [Gossypium tomentosum]